MLDNKFAAARNDESKQKSYTNNLDCRNGAEPKTLCSVVWTDRRVVAFVVGVVVFIRCVSSLSYITLSTGIAIATHKYGSMTGNKHFMHETRHMEAAITERTGLQTEL